MVVEPALAFSAKTFVRKSGENSHSNTIRLVSYTSLEKKASVAPQATAASTNTNVSPSTEGTGSLVD